MSEQTRRCGAFRARGRGPRRARGRLDRPRRAKATFKVAFDTDTAGLNDKSFNHLGNIGRLKAQKDLGIETKVYISKPASRLPAELRRRRPGRARPSSCERLPARRSRPTRRRSSSRTSSGRSPTSRRASCADKPHERVRPGLQVGAVGLPRRLPGRRLAKAKIGPNGKLGRSSERRRRQEDPVGRQLDRRLPRWCEGRRTRASRCSSTTRTTSAVGQAEVQGAGAQADRAGLAGRLPGRRRLRPRRARRCEAEGRSGASASTPTSPTSARTS